MIEFRRQGQAKLAQKIGCYYGFIDVLRQTAIEHLVKSLGDEPTINATKLKRYILDVVSKSLDEMIVDSKSKQELSKSGLKWR